MPATVRATGGATSADMLPYRANKAFLEHDHRADTQNRTDSLIYNVIQGGCVTLLGERQIYLVRLPGRASQAIVDEDLTTPDNEKARVTSRAHSSLWRRPRSTEVRQVC
jgi:hypothetical protein